MCNLQHAVKINDIFKYHTHPVYSILYTLVLYSKINTTITLNIVNINVTINRTFAGVIIRVRFFDSRFRGSSPGRE